MASDGSINGQAGFESMLTMPKGREFKGGDLLAQSLKQLGVTVAFGLHGGHLDAFLMGAHDAGIRLIDTRHETVAVQAAEGYSKVKSQVGTCFFTANSGFANALAGMSTAYADRSSIFCVTSSSPQRDGEMNVLQGFHDQIVVAKPVTRFCHRCVHVEEIPRLVSHAFHVATASPPGPVLIDFPIEVLFSPVDLKRISWGSIRMKPAYPPAPHPEAVKVAAEMLIASRRPVVITGTGSIKLEEVKQFHEFIEKIQLPVFHSNEWAGSLPQSHPLRGGLANRLSTLKAANHPEPDLVILLGARTGFFLGGRSSIIPPPESCQVIHIDVDAGELGRSRECLGIVSDCSVVMGYLIVALEDNSYVVPKDWVKTTMALKSAPLPFDKEDQERDDGRIHPHHALKLAFSNLPKDSTLSIDGGEVGSWAVMLAEHLGPRRVMFSPGYLGFLGNGFGYSLGASVAEPGEKLILSPDRLVINLQGDGSAGLHLAELDTYARFGAKILTIVSNNACWGMSQSGQALFYGDVSDARPAALLSSEMRFSTVAEGLGCKAVRVTRAAEIEDAARMLAMGAMLGRPGLLELVVSAGPVHPGTVAMVGNTDDVDVVVVPYYDNVPRPYFK